MWCSYPIIRYIDRHVVYTLFCNGECSGMWCVWNVIKCSGIWCVGNVVSCCSRIFLVRLFSGLQLRAFEAIRIH